MDKIEEKRTQIIDASGNPMVATPEPEASSIIQIIDRAARDPNVDMDKMERLLAMHERIQDRQAVQEFNVALAAAKSEMPSVVRDENNDHTSSKYATLEAVSKAMDPITLKHGFVHSFGTDVSPLEGHYRIVCELSHISGHSRNYHADVPADIAGPNGKPNKSKTHGFGSTFTYGRRYLKLAIFDVTLVDHDDDGNAASPGETITEKQADNISDLIEEVGDGKSLYRKNFLAHMQVDHIEDIHPKDYQRSIDAINSTRGQ